MKFLKAIATDGETVFLAVPHILSITPKANGTVSVLMGAGLYWSIKPDTMVFVDQAELIAQCMEVNR